MNTLPRYLTLQMEGTLETLTKAAREKGLEEVLAYELWEVRQQAKEALEIQDEALAKRVVNARHDLFARIKALPSRHSDLLRKNQDSLLLSGY